MKVSIELKSDTLHCRERQLANPFHASIPAGITAVIGANGAGKSTLGEVVASCRNFRTNSVDLTPTQPEANDARRIVKKLQFDDIHSLSGLSVEYYQQRYEAVSNDDVPTVGEMLGERITSQQWHKASAKLHLGNVADRKINFLSSGELRKLLMVNVLTDDMADLLILDNPYIGLDAAARQLLDEALVSLSADTSIMLLVADPKDIPQSATTIVPMRDMTILEPITGYERIDDVIPGLYMLFDYAVDVELVPDPPVPDVEALESIVRLNDIQLKYGGRVLLDNFSWTIRPGENWGLFGRNGSGKSTLLSLLTADNPRAYAMDITLFDRQRGTGESIWDVKRRVGYISPELSLHFHPAGTVTDIIAQGLNDTTGLYRRVTPAQASLAAIWMRMLHLDHLADRRWNTLSSGEQQLVLLARVFIKQPRLMIFDEPFHGLDYARKRAIRALINYFAARAEARPSVAPCNIILVTHYDDERPECINHFITL